MFSQEEIDKSFKRYSVNSKIEGEIVLINDKGFVVNIGGKKDAFIYNDELLNKEKYDIGDKITGIIKELRDENGFVRISNKEYEFNKQNEEVFNALSIGKIIEVRPTLVVNGGIIAKYFNFNVFIPISHLENAHKKDPKYYINKLVKVIVIQMEVVSKKIVASIKNYQQQEQELIENDFWNKIDNSPIVKGTVKKITAFGAFITVFGKDCLLLNKDVGYFNETAEQVFKVGDENEFVVLNTDKENHKVLLGFKQLKDDPRIKLYKKYEVGKNYNGEVVKLFNYGAVVQLEENVTGFLHISDAEYGLVNMQEEYKVGDKILVKIKDIDLKKHKISLQRKYDYEYEVE